MSNVYSETPSDPTPAKASGGIPWGPAASVIVSLVAFVGSQLLAGALLVAALKIFGPGGSNLHQLNSIGGQFVFVLLSDLFMLVVIWAFLRGRKANLRQLGFARRPVLKDMGLAFLGYVVYFVLLIVVTGLAGTFTHIDLNQKQELGFDNLLSPSEKLMALVSLVMLAPLVEELIFRGFVFAGLRRGLKFVWATIITSLLFAAPHLLASSDGLLWVAGIDTFVLSSILCYLREKTGALWAPVFVHAFKNALAFMFLIKVFG